MWMACAIHVGLNWSVKMNNYEREVELDIPVGFQRLNVTRSQGEFIHVYDMDGYPVFSLHVSDIRRNSGKIRAALILMKHHRVNYGQAQLDNLKGQSDG